jgi:response regulator RpfG family c-di-GMP phosphodiesterase
MTLTESLMTRMNGSITLGNSPEEGRESSCNWLMERRRRMDNIIWLIDDDESIRESMAFLLSGMGWEVKTFGSIDAFTSAHVKDSTLVGCLLLDMRMPGKGG